MADIAPGAYRNWVTTGPIRGSRKIFGADGVRVALRRSTSSLRPASRRYALRYQRPVPDPEARIDIMAGLSELRRIGSARGDVEEFPPAGSPARGQRPARPRPLGRGVAVPDRALRRPLRAKARRQHQARCTTPAAGIVTPEMEYVAERRNLGRAQILARTRRNATEQDWGASIPD